MSLVGAASEDGSVNYSMQPSQAQGQPPPQQQQQQQQQQNHYEHQSDSEYHSLDGSHHQSPYMENSPEFYSTHPNHYAKNYMRSKYQGWKTVLLVAYLWASSEIDRRLDKFRSVMLND